MDIKPPSVVFLIEMFRNVNKCVSGERRPVIAILLFRLNTEHLGARL